ncbi:group III truncated hemoglobin [Nafulsella turpanensis]|uniref:group III truncated hemoglobin n=1 Tax=Nafulsella turpanensis TaxID=1265690 RepID=UPI0003478EC0|nr:group III truncated hemoglobin [Nafulsella turpanensis]
MKRELNTREDISFLIHTFYGRIRKDEMLGPIFNGMIKNWPEHLERLTDFWETNLTLNRTYRGNPPEAHRRVDRYMDYNISMEHFGQWLQIWFATIDEFFTGTNAQIAKNRARTMSTHLFLRMFENRPKLV